MSLRIIAGACRGRRLKTPTGMGVRPTPDRVRETLFNWLMGDVHGASVLDLFAGSGALGLEALSRGAAMVQFVEQDRRHAEVLRANINACALPGASMAVMNALSFLRGPARPFHLVFLDPPYGKAWIPQVASLLTVGGWLHPAALIYVELEAENAERLPALLPPDWTLLKNKHSGGVGYNLCRYAPVSASI